MYKSLEDAFYSMEDTKYIHSGFIQDAVHKYIIKDYKNRKEEINQINAERQEIFNHSILEGVFNDWINICDFLKINDELEINLNDKLKTELSKVLFIKDIHTENEIQDIYKSCKLIKSDNINTDRESYFSGLDSINIDEESYYKRLDSRNQFFERIENTKSYFEENYECYIGKFINEKLDKIKQNLNYIYFILKERKYVEIDGAFKFYFKFDKDLKNTIIDLANIISKIRNNTRSDSERDTFDKGLKSLRNLELNIFYGYNIFLQNLKNYYNILNKEEIDTLNKSITYIKEKLDFLYNLMPVFYLYKEKNLNDEYIYNDEFLKKFNSSELIYLLFKSIDIKKEALDIIFNDPLSGDAEDMKIEINERLKSIEHEFNQFYNQEKIKISMAFNGNKFSVFIDSTNNKMKISERSRGLRWYLNMFIDMKANDLNNKQVIYLIDEPAVFLHVEAQKEVINLFETLVENNNQLIYATHSPYMIDSNELTRVRALEKEDGITKIHNKVYNEKLSSKSKMETLSPILDAIGLKLKYNLGPHSDMLNIVTEGITDYMYINAMIDYLNIKDIYILPSSGAENVPNIVSILMGWGVDFKALLDYDSEGNKAVKKLAKLGLKINEDDYFLNGKNEFNREEHSVVIEDLIDDSDKEKIREIYLDGDKTINAKIFETKVKKGEIVPSEKTTEKFKTLFKTMGIYNENIE